MTEEQWRKRSPYYWAPRREPVQVTIMRNSQPTFEPQEQVIGPKIALIDEWSASDGDILLIVLENTNLEQL